jgi:Tfp pilus assembly protein PilW
MNEQMNRFLRQASNDQRGLTLTELMVAIAMLMGVLAAAVPVLVSSVRNEPRIRDRSGKIQEARVLMEQLGRDLRSGYAIDTATSSSLVFLSYVHQSTCDGGPSASSSGLLCRVTYSCASGICTRRVAHPTGNPVGIERRLVTGLSNSAVFSYLTPAGGTSPGYVEVSLVFPAAEVGDDAVTLSDGFSFRNLGLTG